MSTRSRQQYFQVLRERYRKTVSKKERSFIIEEAILNTGLHRKSIIRALKQRRHPDGGPPPRLGARGSTQSPALSG